MKNLKLHAARALGLALALAGASAALGQAIGPDMISSSHADVARNTVVGGITAYSVGSVTCNHGDAPAAVQPSVDVRPIVGQGMFRYKTVAAPGGGSYQRFEEIGQGWAKWVLVPGAGTTATCGSCQNVSGGMMGVNCADTYFSGFNGPSNMAMRSLVNAATGTLNGARGGGTGDQSISTRIQVASGDVTAQPAGTRFFVETVHLLPDDALYVRPGQSVAINAMNNAASQEININAGTSNPTLIGGAANQQVAVITRWRDLDPAVTIIIADHDDTPNPRVPGAFIKCRYYVAAKVTDLSGTGAGPWRYEYAVYNLNSDRAASSFTIPFPAAGSFTDFNFRHPPVHSGENISNAPWTATVSGDQLVFATTPYSTAANANAIRWGTLYNFGFTASIPPTTGTGSIGLFKPVSATAGSATAIAVPNLPVPALPPPCVADFNHDGQVNPDDLGDYITCFFSDPPCPSADFNGGNGVNPDDLGDFVTAYFGSAC